MSADWIAAERDGQALRVWAMDAGGILAEVSGHIGPDGEIEPALLTLIEPWLDAGRVMPVLLCGASGKRELPLRPVPCTPLPEAALTPLPVIDPRLRLMVVPGLSQAAPADLMIGDETRIAGALALYPQFDGVIHLPGAQSRWAQISAGEVVSFQTFLTGELIALLSAGAVLAPLDTAAFDAALSEALSRPERLAARLNTIRAEMLLKGLPAAAAQARLSGLLIGAELAAARPYWLGQRVVVIADPQRQAAPLRALATQGISAEHLAPAACTLAGLAAARQRARG